MNPSQELVFDPSLSDVLLEQPRNIVEYSLINSDELVICARHTVCSHERYSISSRYVHTLTAQILRNLSILLILSLSKNKLIVMIL